MAIFYEDARSPIVAELIRQGFEVEESETLRILDIDETAHNTDGAIALGTGAACIAATAGTLALSGFTLSIALPFLGVGLCGMTYWNSKITARDRETEAQFIADHPEVLNKVQAKIRSGAERDSIAAAYQQVLRAYRWGDDVPFDRVLGDSQTQRAVEQSEAASMAQTQIQGNDQGANQSSTPIAAAPSLVQSKVLCPIEILGRDPYQSMGVIGGQRTGKTYTAALHTQNVKRKLGTSIIYINLMDANGDAADDWSHADICITCHLRKLAPNKAKAMIEHVITTVDDFFNGVNQILVFDEWVGFTSKANQWPKKAAQDAAAAAIESKEAKTFIQPEGLGTSAIELMNLVMAVTGELTQSGKKQAKAIWLLSPMVKAGAIEPQGLVIKEVQPMVVAISKERTVSWTHPVTKLAQEIGFDDPGYRASIQNLGLPPIESIPKMDCVRMLFTKGTWYSLDNLPALEQSPPTAKCEKPIAPPPVATIDPIAHLENAYQAPAVEVSMKAIAERRPEGMDEYPIVETVWLYLEGKEPRNLKQIYDAMRKNDNISEDDLRERVRVMDNYKDGLKQVILFGVSRGFITQVSNDTFKAVEKH